MDQDSFYDAKVINQRIIRSSKTRLIVCGSHFELYTYSTPYHFNFPPLKRQFRGQSDKMATVDSDTGRRESNLHSCRQRIRRMIDSNVGQYGEITKFITFTFKENETNLSRANKEYGLFIKRLNYDLKLRSRYITVVEFQKRGAIHYHTLFFNLPYIDQIAPRIEKVWGHGGVDVKAIRHVGRIGAYVTKYIQKDVFDARLAREKAYFCSKGLLKPIELKHEVSIANFLDRCIIDTIAKRQYRSSYYGDIIYQTGLITPK